MKFYARARPTLLLQKTFRTVLPNWRVYKREEEQRSQQKMRYLQQNAVNDCKFFQLFRLAARLKDQTFNHPVAGVLRCLDGHH